MKPLLFILAVTGLSLLIAYRFSPEGSWFSLYIGGIAGLLVSGAALGMWNKRKRAKEEAETKTKSKRNW
jgi:uncharacterized membrane protein YqjE